MSTGEVFQELYLDPAKSSLPAGARIGGLVIMPGLAPVDPQTGAIVGDDMESQLRAVLQNMDRVLAAAGCSKQDVARVTTFMRQTSDRTALNKIYRSGTPNEDRTPAEQILARELCPQRLHVQVQVIALPGNAAKAIEIPGIHHNDWMSLGGINGGLSRLRAFSAPTRRRVKAARKRTATRRNLFENADRLLALAGGQLGQHELRPRSFYQGEHLRDIVMREWRTRGGEARRPPPEHGRDGPWRPVA